MNFEYFEKAKKTTRVAELVKGHEFENLQEDGFGLKKIVRIVAPLHQEDAHDSLLNFSIESL